MKIQKAEIEKFFNLYDSRFNEALSGKAKDVEGVIKSFADDFIEASPLGTRAMKNDAAFEDTVPKGWEYYKKIGVKSMVILQQEITILDDFHAIDKTSWRCSYEKKDSKGHIDFAIFYIVQKLKDAIKIVAFITGDEEKALKDHGLI